MEQKSIGSTTNLQAHSFTLYKLVSIMRKGQAIHKQRINRWDYCREKGVRGTVVREIRSGGIRRTRRVQWWEGTRIGIRRAWISSCELHCCSRLPAVVESRPEWKIHYWLGYGNCRIQIVHDYTPVFLCFTVLLSTGATSIFNIDVTSNDNNRTTVTHNQSINKDRYSTCSTLICAWSTFSSIDSTISPWIL